MVNVVTARTRIEARPARPEVGGRGQHRVPVARQPCGVARREIVLPLGECNVPGDVILVQRILPGEARRRFVAQLVRFPGIHRAAVAVAGRIAARRAERPVAEHDHRLGEARMQYQQRRKHPGVGIPEHVPVVARAREPHRRDTRVRAFAHAREQVEEHCVDHPLQLGIPLQHHVRLPQAVPRGHVLRRQRAIAA